MYVITGGSGLLGNAFKDILPNEKYPNRKILDLTNRKMVFEYFGDIKPNEVIHLAGKVGGVKANTTFMSDFYSENSLINTNVIDACAFHKIPKLVCCLSTCVYPDEQHISYPLTEEQLHIGPPHHSNYGYAYAKRMVDVHLRAVRQQHGLEYISVIPNNMYGENDNFDLENSHVLPAIIRKIWEAKINNNSSFIVWGDGEIYREFTYVKDIANSILFCLENYNDSSPINIGCTKEYKLKYIINLICKKLNYEGEIKFDITKPKGQIKKPTSNKKFIDLGWDEKRYTDIEKGLEETCNWFKNNYPNIRGV